MNLHEGKVGYVSENGSVNITLGVNGMGRMHWQIETYEHGQVTVMMI